MDGFIATAHKPRDIIKTFAPAVNDVVNACRGTRTEYTYDSLNRLTQVLHKDALDNTLASFGYTLDATGRRTQINEATGRTTDYSYDELHRLISETITDPINGNYSASYEPFD